MKAFTLAALTFAATALALPRAAVKQSYERRSDDIVPSYNTTSCPGYKIAGHAKQSKSGFTLPLTLAGSACNAYGVDIKHLTLAVVYEKKHQLHVHIYDTDKQQYQLPDNLILSRPGSDPAEIDDGVTAEESDLEFHHTGDSSDPWAFWITRRNSSADQPPLFDTRPAKIPKYMDAFNSTTDSKRNSTTMPNHNMIFENQYLQLSSALPTDANLYGLGERYSGGNVGDTSWRLNPEKTLQPFFTLDAGDPIDSNMYGYHPVYLEIRNGSDDKISSHVTYYQNTAGLDVLLRPGVIQYRAIGGTLDFRFFSGDEEKHISNHPQTAMEQYVQFVNLPIMNPLWSFGFHLLRWGYKTVQDMRDVRDMMKAADIPLQAHWSDIDWLQSFRDFINDPERYADLPSYVDELHKAGQNYIPIIDAAIPAAPQNSTDVYAPGTRGQELDVFLKNDNETEYVGIVWPGWAFFVDEHHPKAQEWWNEAYKNMSEFIAYDGIWNDMQEPSSFAVGSAGDPKNLSGGNTEHVAATSVAGWPEGYNNNTSGNSGNMTVNGSSTYTGRNIFYAKRELQELAAQLVPRQDADAPAAYDMNDFHYSPANHSYANSTQRFLWDPPYAIHNGIHSSEGDLVDNLNKKTVAMDTVSAGGKFYDVHNIDGSLLMIHTHNALLNIHPDRRPFIVGRSTYPGVGKYVNHWLGDNYSQWSYLAASIQGMLQFQLFGIPTVGPDTCGFNGNTDEELCNRWMMQSAFVPFFRQHNTEGAIDQAPYVWPSVANASRIAIRKRYELLPEIYSARARSSQRGTPMVKSLWMEFTSQAHFAALHKTDSQFMLGSNLLVSPVLEPNVSSIQAYFPEANGLWRNIFTYEALDVPANTNTTISAPISTINVHLRPGRAILTFKEARYTIGETAKQPYKLIVNVDRSGSATGSAYVDDGSSNLPTPSKELTFKAVSGSLSGSVDGDYTIDNKLDDFILLGIEKQPEKITVNGRDAHSSSIFDPERNLLNITQADIDINKAWTVTWS